MENKAEEVKEGNQEGLNFKNQKNVPLNLQMAGPRAQARLGYESYCLKLSWAGQPMDS